MNEHELNELDKREVTTININIDWRLTLMVIGVIAMALILR